MITFAVAKGLLTAAEQSGGVRPPLFSCKHGPFLESRPFSRDASGRSRLRPAPIDATASRREAMSSIDPTGNAALAAALRKSLHEHWRLLLAEGIILVLLGIAAILLPPVAGLAITIFVGWLLLIGGVVGVVATLSARHAPGFGWSLLS